jgi:antitoxin HicB
MEGDTVEEALAHVQDAVQAVVELYDDLGKLLPADLCHPPQDEPLTFEYAVTVATPCIP